MRKPRLSKTRVGQLARVSLVGFLLVAILGTSFSVKVPRARALIPVEEVGPNLVAGQGNWWTDLVTTIEQTVDTVAEVWEKAKEGGLDKIAWFIAKQALQQIQRETVNWINSGFDGSPAFVQDLGGFLEDNADKVAGEFIYGSDLKALCSPFALNIRIALSVKYLQKQPPARCTLSGVVGNVENFLAGSFAEGGLPGWFELTVNPNNNFFGASAAAESALLGKLGKKREVDLNKLIFGKGFLGKEVCDPVATEADPYGIDTAINNPAEKDPYGTDQAINNYGGPKTPQKKNCKTVTPGDTISSSLNKSLGAGQDALVTADEINEIISALFQQLAVQVLTGARGLLGTSEPTGNDKPSYLNQIHNPAFDSFHGQTTIGTDLMSDAIKDEGAFNALYANVVSKADAILERIRAGIAEFTAKAGSIGARIAQLDALVANDSDDEIWTCSNMDDIRARLHAIPGEVTALTDPLRTQVTDIRTPASAILTESNNILATLNDLNTRYQATTKNAPYSTEAAEENLRVSEVFLDLQSSGKLHRASSIPEHKRATDPIVSQLGNRASDLSTLEQNELAALRNELATLASQVESRCHMTKKPKN